MEYFPSEEPIFKTAVLWHVPPLPIQAGQKVAEMQILSLENKLLSSASLFAVRAIEPTFRYQVYLVWKKVKKGAGDNIALVMAGGGILILAGTFYYANRFKHSKEKKGQ